MNNVTPDQSSKDTDILDEAEFVKNFQQLEESIHLDDLEQISLHSGYESVTFGRSQDLHFLDFKDPA